MNNEFVLMSVLTAMINDQIKNKKKSKQTKIFLAIVAALMIITGIITLTELWVDVDCDEEEDA